MNEFDILIGGVINILGPVSPLMSILNLLYSWNQLKEDRTEVFVYYRCVDAVSNNVWTPKWWFIYNT